MRDRTVPAAPGRQGCDGVNAAIDLVIRSGLDRREFVAFRTAGGRVLAGMNVNVRDVSDAIQDLVRAGWAGRWSTRSG